MKHIFSLTLVLTTFIVFSQSRKPIIVAELFTSQGCHSCPPADKLLSEIVDNKSDDVEILALSFHVDYWNYIGWNDPYSSSAYSNRQRSYASKFRNNQVYTPQLIVNGKHEFVGSNRAKWNTVLKFEKSEKYHIIDFKNIVLEKNRLTFKIASVDSKERLYNVAIVERDLTKNVTRGENKGRILHNDNVVRVYDQSNLKGEGNFQLLLPSDLKIENSSLIIYAQDVDSWRLTGANKLDLIKI